MTTGLYDHFKILVIDDHAIQRKVVAKRLQALGVVQVIEAGDGGEGLRVLAEHKVDLVLCDLDMPYIDGLEFVRCVVDASLDVAVAFLSAADPVIIECADLMTREQPIRFLGAIEKPVTTEQLAQLLDEVGVVRPSRPLPETQPIERLLVALERNEMVPYFQPIVSAATGAPTSFEALARWVHPTMGVLAPVHFLSALEDHPAMAPFTWAIFDGAIKALEVMAASGVEVPVSINLSARFLASRGIADAIRDRLGAAGVAAHLVTFEVTESIALTTAVDCLENLARLRMRGHSLVADDFGTAYASLKQLVRVPFQVMKFDRSLMLHALAQDRAWTVLRSSVAMARELHMATVIEGIETQAQLDRIAEIRCDHYQGFYFGKPMPVDKLGEWLRARA